MAVDISAITSQFSVSLILVPVLQVVAVLAAIVAVLGSIGFVYALIRGDSGIQSDFGRVTALRDSLSDNRRFAKRYALETRNARYAQWKKRKGY